VFVVIDINSTSDALSTGVIVGIVIGAFFFTVFIALLVYSLVFGGSMFSFTRWLKKDGNKSSMTSPKSSFGNELSSPTVNYESEYPGKGGRTSLTPVKNPLLNE
jgi:hypothetical protein